jgi:hypothetical protein
VDFGVRGTHIAFSPRNLAANLSYKREKDLRYSSFQCDLEGPTATLRRQLEAICSMVLDVPFVCKDLHAIFTLACEKLYRNFFNV